MRGYFRLLLNSDPAFADLLATLQEGRQVLREQLQQMDMEVVDWASLECLQQSSSELGDQAEVLLAIMTAQGSDEVETAAAQGLVLFFTHTSVHRMIRLGLAQE